MGSPNVSERLAAIKELRGKSGKSGKYVNAKIVPIILQAAKDPDVDVRMYAFYAIGRVDPREEGVIEAVFAGMADTSVFVRRAVVSALGEFEPFPSACIPYLIKMLVDPDQAVRQLAHTTLVDLPGTTGVGTLIRNIDVADQNLRLAVIITLGAIGPPAKSILARLKTISQEDNDEGIREAAANAVKRIER
jgi:HEAT repeat protein